MRRHADREFDTAKELVQIVRGFRAVLTAHVLKYRAVDGTGAVAAFAADVERDRVRCCNKFSGIREPSLASFAKCAEQLIDALAAKATGQGIGRSRNSIKTNKQKQEEVKNA
jgi:hypothetical protein